MEIQGGNPAPRFVRHTLLLLFACWGAAAQNNYAPATTGQSPYIVGPGDVLDVQVFGADELSKPVVVDSRGLISVPLLPGIEAAGLTTFEIESELTESYGRDYLRDPRINVTVREFRSQPITILGAVERPGIYQLQGKRRLLEVLAMAGGLSPKVGQTLTISRVLPPNTAGAVSEASEPKHGSRELRVQVRELLTLTSDNPVIEPHDLIHVEEAGIVYVVGAVGRPGGFPLQHQETITVLRAVSLAAGPDRDAALQKARIIRQTGGREQEIETPIRDILRGRLPDPPLEAGDILYIPPSRAKNALRRSAEAAIQLGTGLAIWRR